jgi:hypothetical protein
MEGIFLGFHGGVSWACLQEFTKVTVKLHENIRSQIGISTELLQHSSWKHSLRQIFIIHFVLYNSVS